MTTNYDTIKNQNKSELAKTLAEIWFAALVYNKNISTPDTKQVGKIINYLYTWLGEEADE